METNASLPSRRFGKTDVKISALGWADTTWDLPRTSAMGSTGLQVSILDMGTVAGQEQVNNMVAKALDHGINFFDNAWDSTVA